jgi:hypothetical protein
MPIERDNDAERNARIEQILKQLQGVQERVEELAASGQRRAREIADARRNVSPDAATSEPR